MARVTTWKSSEWARWLGWTVVFALLFGGVMFPFTYDAPDSEITPVPPLALAASIVLSSVAAFKIGVRFPSPRWWAGPPTAILATVLAFLLLPSSSPPRQTAVGMVTPKEEFLFLLIFRGGGIVLGLLALIYALLARAGVKRGQRREETAFREAVRSDVDSRSGGAEAPSPLMDDGDRGWIARRAGVILVLLASCIGGWGLLLGGAMGGGAAGSLMALAGLSSLVAGVLLALGAVALAPAMRVPRQRTLWLFRLAAAALLLAAVLLVPVLFPVSLVLAPFIALLARALATPWWGRR